MGCAGSSEAGVELVGTGGFTEDKSVSTLTTKETVIESKDPSLLFLGVFQKGGLQTKAKEDSAKETRSFDVLVDGDVAFTMAITALQLKNEVGAKYTSIVLKSKDGKKILCAKNEPLAGSATKDVVMFTYEARGENATASTAKDDDGDALYPFGEAIKHPSMLEGKLVRDAEGNFKKNKYPRTEYKVGGTTLMSGTTRFVKEYYFRGIFNNAAEEGPIADFTYLQKNVRNESDGSWSATVWRSMRCAAGVDAAGLFIAGIALEHIWYCGFAVDED